MPDRVTRQRWPRRLAASAIVVALAADLALLALAHEARASRTPVRVTFSVENAIVQVLVGCRVAYYFRDERAIARSVDLGWLKKDETLTFQVRSRKHVGFYALFYRRGASLVALTRRGSLGHLVELPESQAVFEDSWSVGGEHLAAFGCQADTRELAFADPRSPNWDEGAAKRLELVTALAGVVPWVWAILGATGLIAFFVAGRISVGRWTRRTVIPALLALAEIAIPLIASLAGVAPGVVFSLAVVAGVGSLVVAVLWLLRDDLHRWTAPREQRRAARSRRPIK